MSPAACSARSRGCSRATTGAYSLTLEQVWDKLRSRQDQALTEVHVVNGLHPDLPFDYYLELLRGFKRIRPDVHLKCFTAVEIAFFADLYGRTDEQVLRELMAAGLDSLPGGGAEECSRNASAARSATTSAAPSAIWTSTGPRTGWACART